MPARPRQASLTLTRPGVAKRLGERIAIVRLTETRAACNVGQRKRTFVRSRRMKKSPAGGEDPPSASLSASSSSLALLRASRGSVS
jgi:hypothetical protein